MQTITLNRAVPVAGEYDVVVVGGGPAGCTAAASAAREGRKTLLIEAGGSLGGMGTGGLVPAWCPFSDQEKIIYRGMAETIFSAAKAASPHIQPGDLDWVPIDPEALKRLYDAFVTGYGAQVLFNTVFSGVETDGPGRVTAVIVSNKQGLSAYRGKVFIDCTGDADLVVAAGGEYEQGDDNGEMMPATLCFVLTNVDEYAYQYDRRSGQHYGGIHPNNKNSIIYAIARDDRYPHIVDSHLCSQVIGPKTIGFNAGHIWNVDNTDPAAVSRALMQGRVLAEEFRQALADYYPSAFASAYLVSTAQLMGVREGRRIIGDYTMTIRDYLDRRTFADEISRNSYYIDIHFTPEEAAAELENGLDMEARGMYYGKGESHGIPYRSLVPRTLRNVLVAGRSISCDRRLLASLRVMPNCLCTGEAAGLAAALAAGQDGNVHAVDTGVLRRRLKEEGAYFL